MSNIIKIQNINNLRYIVSVSKAVDETQKGKIVERYVYVIMRNIQTHKQSDPLPISKVADAWMGKKLTTIKSHVSRFVRMLNYLTFETKQIDEVGDITPTMVLDFFEYLSKSSGRNYTKQSERSITRALLYLFKKGALPNFTKDDFYEVVNKQGKVYPFLRGLHNNYVFPQKRNKHNVHDMPLEVVFQLLQIAIEEAPDIAIGMYFGFFGGCRASEIVSIEYSDIAYNLGDSTFYVTLKNKDLRPDITTGFIAQTKRPRKQLVFKVEGLWDEIYNISKTLTQDSNYNSIMLNKNGKPMTYESYLAKFKRVQRLLVKRLSLDEDPQQRLYGLSLSTKKFGTHVCRGVYSNLVANNATTSIEIARLRGDSGLTSSLPYLEHTDNVTHQIETTLDNIYNKKE